MTTLTVKHVVGFVKSLSAARSFGLLKRERGPVTFFHFSNASEPERLTVGQRVAFMIRDRGDKLEAFAVEPFPVPPRVEVEDGA